MTQAAARAFAKITLNLPRNTHYLEMPLAFCGKDERFNELSYFAQFMLAEIHTTTRNFGAPAVLTYDYFVQKYGCSRETVSAAKKALIARGIIEELGGSKYRIKPNYDRKNRLIIDCYLLTHKFDVCGKARKLARSQIELLAFLEQHCTNPKTYGRFLSSYKRIGKAVAMPKSTAGKGLRLLAGAGLIYAAKFDESGQAYRKGLRMYDVHPSLLNVKRLNSSRDKQKAEYINYNRYEPESEEDEETRFKRLYSVLLTQLSNDKNYVKLCSDIEEYKAHYFELVEKRDIKGMEAAERHSEELKEELRVILKKYNVSPEIFPKGYFYIS